MHITGWVKKLEYIHESICFLSVKNLSTPSVPPLNYNSDQLFSNFHTNCGLGFNSLSFGERKLLITSKSKPKIPQKCMRHCEKRKVSNTWLRSSRCYDKFVGGKFFSPIWVKSFNKRFSCSKKEENGASAQKNDWFSWLFLGFILRRLLQPWEINP